MQTEEIKTETEVNPTEKEFKIIIPNDKIVDEMNNEFNQLKSQIKLPNFRKGKAPEWLLKKKYWQTLYHQTVNKKIEESVKDKTKDLNLATQPIVDGIDPKEGEDVVCNLKVEIIPEIDIPDLQKITITRPTYKISDDDINSELSKFVKSVSKPSPSLEKDTVIDKNHLVNVDINIKSDNRDETKSLYIDLLDDENLTDELKKEFFGKKVGDVIKVEKSFNEIFIDSKDEKLVKLVITIKNIHKKEIPEINDDLAKNNGYQNLDELKGVLQDQLEELLNSKIKTLLSIKLFDELDKILVFDVPNSLMEKELNNVKMQLAVKVHDELKGKSEEELNEIYKKFATRRVKIGLFLMEYAKKFNIQVNNTDLRHVFMEYLKGFPDKLQPEILKRYHENPNYINQFTGKAIENKVMDEILFNKIKLENNELPISEIEKIIQEESDRDII